MEDNNTRTILVQQMDKGHLASLIQGYLTEWLDQYQEVIIDNLKRCPEQEMGRHRSLLVASEVFKAKLQSDVLNGLTAEEDLLQLNKENAEDAYEKDSKLSDSWW